MKDKINEFATICKNNIRDLYRGIIEFKMGYQPRNDLVKDENGDLLADSHNQFSSAKHRLALQNGMQYRPHYDLQFTSGIFGM
jgi:hypothetical protein